MIVQNQEYGTLVCGATFASLGMAYGAEAPVLVVDRTAMAGHEFINAFQPGSGWNDVQLSEEGRRLKDELLERNILSQEGRVHIPAVATVLYNRIQNDELPYLFMTEVIDVKSIEGKFEVTIYNASGMQKITAGSIVDTTSTCLSVPGRKAGIRSKTLNAMLHSNEPYASFPAISEGDIALLQGRFDSEGIARFRLEPDDDWQTARRKLHRFWTERPACLAPWTIAAVAACFDVQVEKGPCMIADRWEWLPSSAYRNPLESFEAGLAFISREGGV